MATTKPSSSPNDPLRFGGQPPASPSPGPRRAGHWAWRGLAAIVIIGLVVGAVFVAFVWRPAHDNARIEAARAARLACSCRYIGGRALGDCEKDNPKGRFPVSLAEDATTHSVTATVPLAAAQTATYREGWGCQLQAWRD
ncbi:hypothetical protein ABIC78_000260 [Novosphingobium sp. 1529]|uniref:hypothetical protein n=1 Tax=Novosphingobium sp. 1529 TaxID=3156424 RepID=UPI003394F377